MLWCRDSGVPRKHDAGGQSNRRFERGREEKLKQWLRAVVDVLIETDRGLPFIVAGPGMTKDKFVEELPQRFQQRVVRTENCGYTDENGLWEVVGKSRYS